MSDDFNDDIDRLQQWREDVKNDEILMILTIDRKVLKMVFFGLSGELQKWVADACDRDVRCGCEWCNGSLTCTKV